MQNLCKNACKSLTKIEDLKKREEGKRKRKEKQRIQDSCSEMDEQDYYV